MKKASIIIMLMITMGFATFIAGFYLGRHYDPVQVQIQGVPTLPKTTTATKPTVTNPLPTSPSVPTDPSNPTKPVPTEPEFPLDINSATLEQLDLLPGIGPKLGQAIIDYRNEFGPFLTLADLMRVPGIGEKKLEAIIDYIYIPGGNNENIGG